MTMEKVDLEIEEKELPVGWEWKRLGEVCQPVSSVKRKLIRDEDEFIYLDIGGIDNKTNLITSSKTYRWADAPSRAQQIVKQGDILFSTVRTYLRNIAQVTSPEFENQIASSGFCIIRANQTVCDPRFLFWKVLEDDFLAKLGELQTGSSYPAVRDKDVFAQIIPLPPLAEQQRIVAQIEALFSEMEAGKARILAAQQQLKTYRQSVLKWAFEGRLTREDVVDGELPEGWSIFPAEEILDSINSGSTPSKENLLENHGDIPFIKVYNLTFNGKLDFSKDPTFVSKEIHAKALKRSICYPGDVLINIVGPPLGKVSVVPDSFPEWNINQAIVAFRPNDLLISGYLTFFLQNPVVIDWLEQSSKATSGQWNVKVTTCRKIPIPLPPLEEQHRIVQEIESRLGQCDTMEAALQAALQQAEALRQSILKQAFEGKLLPAAASASITPTAIHP